MLNQLVSDIQAEVIDQDGSSLFSDPVIKNLVRRSLAVICFDLDCDYDLIEIQGSDPSDYTTSPEMDSYRREIWIMQVKLRLFKIKNLQTAGLCNWKSRDVSSDRANEPLRWRNLFKDLEAEYIRSVQRLNSDFASNSVDAGVAATTFLRGKDSAEENSRES